MPTSKNGIPMLQNSGSTGKFDIVSKHAGEALDALVAFDEYGGQPCRINDLTLIKQRTAKYIEDCKINSTLPTWTGLAARLGVTRNTVNDWIKDSNYPDTQQYMKFIKQVFADIIEQAALDGSVDKIFSMFLLKSTHEYQETNKVVMNNCFECDNCVYVGEGGYFCDVVMDIVIEDWLPTDSFGGCKNEMHTD